MMTGVSVLPGEVSSVHAIVKDIDSSNLTQTQVAESHHQAVSENTRISLIGQTCLHKQGKPSIRWLHLSSEDTGG